MCRDEDDALISFDRIARAHFARYPLMQAEDLYKLAHQACLGSEHAVRDLDGVRRWLERELVEMGDGPGDPLVDPISPDGTIVRVHLRPYIAQGHDPARLLNAFVRTANDYRGSLDRLKQCWDEVVALADAGRLPLSARALRDLGAPLAARGFPAIHHSAAYEQAYRPAYRVVAREYLTGILPGIPPGSHGQP